MRKPVALIAECELTLHTDREFNISIREVLEMDDLSRVVLKSDRGFGARVFPTGPIRVDPASLDGGVRSALLPDDAEETGEEREWGWLAEIANELGIPVAAAELRSLPSRIEYDHLAPA